jgi:hypothetical protein
MVLEAPECSDLGLILGYTSLKTFFHSSTVFFQERSNLIKKYVITSKIQNGGQKSKRRQKCDFLVKNRLKRRLLSKH